jgi:hypothetical protein
MTKEEFKEFLFSAPITPHEKYGTDKFLRMITPILWRIRYPFRTIKNAFRKFFRLIFT